MVNLFQNGEFKLNSGRISKWKLECDAFTQDDIETLAIMIKEMVGDFRIVLGVPTGGIRLQEALKKHETGGPVLIVDDVLTTGGSIKRFREKFGVEDCIGAVVFARGPCPKWIKPLFTIHECFWDK